MICYECGHRIKGDFAKFCDHCGSSLEIKSKKQALRDVTNLVSEAEIIGDTVDEVTTELKAIWNEDLLGPKPQ